MLITKNISCHFFHVEEYPYESFSSLPFPSTPIASPSFPIPALGTHLPFGDCLWYCPFYYIYDGTLPDHPQFKLLLLPTESEYIVYLCTFTFYLLPRSLHLQQVSYQYELLLLPTETYTYNRLWAPVSLDSDLDWRERTTNTPQHHLPSPTDSYLTNTYLPDYPYTGCPRLHLPWQSSPKNKSSMETTYSHRLPTWPNYWGQRDY